MRTMLKISFASEPGNRAIKDGSLPKIVETFMQRFKPESAYFYASGGKRTMQFVLDLSDASDFPSIAEPFFMGLSAEISATPVMNADDLRKGLEKLSK